MSLPLGCISSTTFTWIENNEDSKEVREGRERERERGREERGRVREGREREREGEEGERGGGRGGRERERERGREREREREGGREGGGRGTLAQNLIPDYLPFGTGIHSFPLEWAWQSVCEREYEWAGSQQVVSKSGNNNNRRTQHLVSCTHTDEGGAWGSVVVVNQFPDWR